MRKRDYNNIRAYTVLMNDSMEIKCEIIVRILFEKKKKKNRNPNLLGSVILIKNNFPRFSVGKYISPTGI